MATSKRMFSQHFNVDGAAKKPFISKERAERAAWIHGMNCYECDFCGYWHLTKKEKN